MTPWLLMWPRRIWSCFIITPPTANKGGDEEVSGLMNFSQQWKKYLVLTTSFKHRSVSQRAGGQGSKGYQGIGEFSRTTFFCFYLLLREHLFSLYRQRNRMTFLIQKAFRMSAARYLCLCVCVCMHAKHLKWALWTTPGNKSKMEEFVLALQLNRQTQLIHLLALWFETSHH